MAMNLAAFLLIIAHSALIAFCVHWINTEAVDPVAFICFIFLAIVNAVGIALNVFTIAK
jgi:hypothetical protein